MVGTALLIAVLVGAGSLVLDSIFEERLQKPAEEEELEREERQERQRNERERSLDEKVDELEDKIKKTNDLIDDERIDPGPGRIPSTGDRDRGQGPQRESPGPPDRESPSDDDPPVTASRATCRGERATIVGTSGDDVLKGTSGEDVIAGLGGDDRLRGGSGADYLCGGDGNDQLYGDDGRDSLVGDAGDDDLDGGADLDLVHFPGAPRDVNVNFARRFIAGDGDDDVVRVEGAEGSEFGDNFVGNDEPNIFLGRGGDDALNGLGGRDVFFPGPGNDGMIGHGGLDTLAFAPGDGSSGVRVDLPNHIATGEGTDRMHGMENVNGTAGDDTITAGDKPSSLVGGPGDDTLTGAGGDDVLIGDDGRDTLDGGENRDVLDGGPGHDTCVSGEKKSSCEDSGPLGAFLFVGLLFQAFAMRSRRKRLI